MGSAQQARRPRLSWFHTTAAVLASLGLLAAIYFAIVFSGLAAMGTSYCGSSPDNVLCDDQGWTIATRGPIISATLGCLIGLGGAWIWPRRPRWLWLTVGYLIVIAGVATVQLWLNHITTRLGG